MSDVVTDRELLAQAISGDRAALHELMLVHYQALLRHIEQRIGPPLRGVVSAEDIIQQTFVEVIRDLEHFKPRTEQSFFAWLKRIRAESCTD